MGPVTLDQLWGSTDRSRHKHGLIVPNDGLLNGRSLIYVMCTLLAVHLVYAIRQGRASIAPVFLGSNPTPLPIGMLSIHGMGSCVWKSSLKCDNKNSSTNENQDGFLPVSSIKLPNDGYNLSQVQSHKHCESTCFSNCSCSAYAYIGNQCRIFFGEIRNLKHVSSGITYANVLYLRLAASELPGKKSRKIQNSSTCYCRCCHFNFIVSLLGGITQEKNLPEYSNNKCVSQSVQLCLSGRL